MKYEVLLWKADSNGVFLTLGCIFFSFFNTYYIKALRKDTNPLNLFNRVVERWHFNVLRRAACIDPEYHLQTYFHLWLQWILVKPGRSKGSSRRFPFYLEHFVLCTRLKPGDSAVLPLKGAKWRGEDEEPRLSPTTSASVQKGHNTSARSDCDQIRWHGERSGQVIRLGWRTTSCCLQTACPANTSDLHHPPPPTQQRTWDSNESVTERPVNESRHRLRLVRQRPRLRISWFKYVIRNFLYCWFCWVCTQILCINNNYNNKRVWCA